MGFYDETWGCSLGLGTSIDVVLTAAASDHVEDGTDGKTDSNNPADPHVELGEGERGTEYVEERLDPQRVHEGAVFHDVTLLYDNPQEEEGEECIITLHNDGVYTELAVCDSKDRE